MNINNASCSVIPARFSVILPMLRDSESFFKKDCGQAAMTARLIHGDITDVISFS